MHVLDIYFDECIRVFSENHVPASRNAGLRLFLSLSEEVRSVLLRPLCHLLGHCSDPALKKKVALGMIKPLIVAWGVKKEEGGEGFGEGDEEEEEEEGEEDLSGEDLVQRAEALQSLSDTLFEEASAKPTLETSRKQLYSLRELSRRSSLSIMKEVESMGLLSNRNEKKSKTALKKGKKTKTVAVIEKPDREMEEAVSVSPKASPVLASTSSRTPGSAKKRKRGTVMRETDLAVEEETNTSVDTTKLETLSIPALPRSPKRTSKKDKGAMPGSPLVTSSPAPTVPSAPSSNKKRRITPQRVQGSSEGGEGEEAEIKTSLNTPAKRQKEFLSALAEAAPEGGSGSLTTPSKQTPRAKAGKSKRSLLSQEVTLMEHGEEPLPSAPAAGDSFLTPQPRRVHDKPSMPMSAKKGVRFNLKKNCYQGDLLSHLLYTYSRYCQLPLWKI